MRYNIDSYEFDLIHAETKISTLAVDEFLLSGSEVGVLLWYGDLEAAKAGWRKQIEMHKQIHALVQKGERSWSEYLFELVMYSPLTLLSGMLAADEMGLVRELIPHTLTGIALRDSMVALELEVPKAKVTAPSIFLRNVNGFRPDNSFNNIGYTTRAWKTNKPSTVKKYPARALMASIPNSANTLAKMANTA